MDARRITGQFSVTNPWGGERGERDFQVAHSSFRLEAGTEFVTWPRNLELLKRIYFHEVTFIPVGESGSVLPL